MKWIKRGILSERIRGGIVATVVLVVALLAGIAWWQKNEAENRKEAAQVSEKKANDARDQADGLINFMLYNLRDKLVPIGRSDVLNDVARKAKEYLERLPIELVNASRQHQRASMLNNLGDILVTQGEAKPGNRQAPGRANAGWQRALSVSYHKVGEVLVAQGRIQEALEAYQQDLAIAKRLAEQDKSNPVWQRDLSISYDRVGNVLVAQGRIQEALNAYQQGLNIRRRLAEQDKSNATWQRDLIVCLYRTGVTTAIVGTHDSLGEAQDFLRTALKLTDKYYGPDRQQLVDDLNGALQNLVH